MSQTSLGTPESPPIPRYSGRWAAARRLVRRSPVWQAGVSVVMTLGVITSMLAPAAVSSLAPTFAATGTDGIMVLNNATLPRGATWLDSATGGHLWITDAVQGICRVDPLPSATPPWQRTNCNGTAKSGGQIVVGDVPTPLPAGVPAGTTKFVYLADNGSKSTQVVRFAYNPAGDGTLNAPLTMTAQNNTSVGGGAGGGRPVGVALIPNKTTPTDDDLYVAYLKSGDVMRITNVKTLSAAPPVCSGTVVKGCVAQIGSTSDGRGVNALVKFINPATKQPDLYLAELGGFGLSLIEDPSGFGRAPCTATAQCTAAHPNPLPSFFPGGLVVDPTGTYIYIGDAPRANVNSILRYNPATGVTDTYSLNVPAYTATFNNTTYTQYMAPFGLGVAANGDLYVGDDPTQGLPLPGQAAPATVQGHIWRVPAGAVGTPANPVSVTGLAPTSGTSAGGTVVTITGTGFSTAAGSTTVSFGGSAGTAVSCASATSCTATTPAASGTVDVRVSVNGQQSPINAPADQFTFNTPAPTSGIAVTGLAPTSGATVGQTHVTITGRNLATVDAAGNVTGQPTVKFGANAATNVLCTSATTCAAVAPAGAAGAPVDVQVTLGTNTSSAVAADKYTYVQAVADLYAWGITAPKGGALWLNGSLGGHWWSSDHAQGVCRQDQLPGPVPSGATTLHALNFSVCGDDLVGSAGQAVLDPRPIPGAANTALRYVYVPDNAVKSTAVWRLTFDPSTETMVPDPLGGARATAMTPLADVRTLKPNGMALGPDGSLYVTDLTEANVRKITNPNGDPRTQVISIVAQTGDLRGANGTQGFIGNLLYISENRGTSFFDVTQCPMANGSPCGTVKIPMNVPAAGVFVAGTAVDPVHKFVYASDSPGGASAGIYRYDASYDAYQAFAAGSAGANPNCDPANSLRPAGCVVGPAAQLIVTGGTLPAAGSPAATVDCAQTCTRPWDTNFRAGGPGSTTGFSFTFGLAVDDAGNLVITEDPSAGARSGRGTMWRVPFVN